MEITNMIARHFSKSHNISKDYEFDRIVGSGGYGTVYQAYNKISQEKRAIKIIKKKDVIDKKVFEHETRLLLTMDHPNIIKLYEVYETEDFIYLVTEFCEGGELFFHITKTQHLTEGEASKIIRQISSALCHCHKLKVCHRDIKPENFLLKFENDISSVKQIDFGLAQQLVDGQTLTDPNGTPFYIAPEIIKGSYNYLCDNWSIGIILYVMLCGCPPFYGSNNKEIFTRILKGTYTFNLRPFKVCSDEVKDLIAKLLVVKPEKRYTTEQIYNHPWVQRQVDLDIFDIEISPAVIEKMAKFHECQHLKKTVCYLVAKMLPEEDIQDFRSIFVKLDKNGDGKLHYNEFKDVFKELEHKKNISIPDDDVDALFKSQDLNRSGNIDYTEFLAAFTQNEYYQKEKYLYEAFRKIDSDHDNKITKAELEAFYSREIQYLNDEQLIKCIEECDYNQDGVIDYNELIQLMKGKR